MSWIKDNKFIATLGGITLVGAAGLIFAGLQGSGRYAEAKASYDEATSQAGSSESLALYPTKANEQGKSKAVADYRGAVEGLQTDFGKFRPAEITNISPQEFTNKLTAAKTEALAAFETSRTAVPGNFFLGFENYTGALARGTATGILDYQLGAAKELFISLGKAGPSQLVNVHRPRLPEEDGAAFTPGPNDASRALPIEITFKGTEASARAFFTEIAKSEKYFYVIRSLRISNEKRTPPLATDAKFDSPASSGSSEPAPASDPGFVLPDDPAAAAPAPGAADAPAAPEPAPAAAVDTGKILTQVLGSEEVYVFVRLDILQFLPVKPLPQP